MGLNFTPGANKGELGDIALGWSVSEYASPVVPGKSFDGTNTATYTGVQKPDSIFLIDKEVTISHVSEQPNVATLGSLTGDVQSVSPRGATVSVSQNSLLTKVNVNRTAKAIAGGVRVGKSFSITSREGKYGSFGLTAVDLSRDGKFIFILSRTNAGTTSMLSKISALDGTLIWKVTIIPGGIYPEGMGISDNGSIWIKLNDTTVGVYNQANGAQYATGQLNPPNAVNSAEPYRNAVITFSSDRTGSMYIANAAERVENNGSTSNLLGYLDMGKKEYKPGLSSGIGTFDALQRPVFIRHTVSKTNIRPFFQQWISGDRVLAYGPVLDNDPSDTGWGIYQPAAWSSSNSYSRIKFFSSPYGPEAGVTFQSDEGFFFIGDRQYDADGVEVQSLEGSRRSVTDKLIDNTKWQAIGQSGAGELVFMSLPNWNTGTPTSVIQFDTFAASVSLSQAISYYFGLVLGSDYYYPITFQGTSDPTVILPGWTGNVLDRISDLLYAYGMELVLIDNKFVIRDTLSTVLDVEDVEISPSVSASVVGNSRTVAVSYTNARTVSGSGSPARKLVNLSRNPVVINSTADYAGYKGTVLMSNPNDSNWRGLRYSTGTPTPVATSESYIVYGSAIIGGARIGNYKRMGLTPGVTYTITVRIQNPEVQTTQGLYVHARRYAIRMNKPDGTAKFIYSEQIANQRGIVKFVTLDFYFDPEYDDIALLMFDGGDGAYPYRGSPLFGPIRISPKGLETAEYPDSEIYYGGIKGWQWEGTAGLSTSSISLAEVPADNLLYDARADDNRTYSVAARGREVFTVTSKAYPTYIGQPTPTSSLDAPYGTYYVSGQDNLPVQAAQWSAYGGRVEVTQGEDPNQLDILLVGPASDIPGVPGPYKLAASDDKNDYAFLSIIGSGVRVDPKEIRVPTGVEESKITREDSGVVENFAIRTIEQAYDAAYVLSNSQGAASVTYDFSVPINKIEKFGITPGATFTAEQAVFRVVNVRIGNARATITAEQVTTVDAVFALYPEGTTYDQVMALWTDYTFHDTILRPLRPLA